MSKNFEHLEGKKIQYRDIEVECVVAGCDYDIGISVVLGDEMFGYPKGTETMCLHGKSSPHRKDYEDAQPDYASNYDNAFDVLVGEIVEGNITSDINILLNDVRVIDMDDLFGLMGSGTPECGFK